MGMELLLLNLKINLNTCDGGGGGGGKFVGFLVVQEVKESDFFFGMRSAHRGM